MKRFLLWVVGVILGVAVLLGAVMTVSYSFTGEGSRPAADTQFGGQALEVNGSCWQVPLLGGVFDKVFTSPETLTVQKLGVLYDAHPALALPDWASYTTLTIETDIGSIVFAGSASQYEDFLFPANGDYKAKLTVWRLPQDYLATQFEGGSTGAIRKNLGVEHPAKPTGWYSYSFRFTLQASAEVTLSTERLEQGGVAAIEKVNIEKAKLLYDYLDGSSFFSNPVNKPDRSIMNVTFTSPSPELDKKFCAEAAAAGFVNLKGHRLVGGMRASIYNAMPAEGVARLVEFMKQFEADNA